MKKLRKFWCCVKKFLFYKRRINEQSMLKLIASLKVSFFSFNADKKAIFSIHIHERKRTLNLDESSNLSP